MPKPKRKVEEGVRQAQLILLTSQEIDALCEGDNVPLARRTMDEILHQLHRAFRVLASLGVERFIVAADHGYIFGDELDESMKVDAPRGETVDLHRRVWVGRGGNADDAFLRAKLADFNLGADLELATPWGFGAFKAKGGAKAFFHGGLSLQELIIPIVTLVPLKQPTPSSGASFEWTLLPGSEKISTRFFSVQIKASTSNLLDLAPPKIRLEIRMVGKVLSTPVSASYGFEDGTGNVQLKLVEDNRQAVDPNTVTLFIQGGDGGSFVYTENGSSAITTLSNDLMSANSDNSIVVIRMSLSANFWKAASMSGVILKSFIPFAALCGFELWVSS